MSSSWIDASSMNPEYTIPKKKQPRLEQRTLLREVATETREFQEELFPLIKRNARDAQVIRKLHFSRCYFVENGNLSHKFEQRRNRLRQANNYTPQQLQVSYGFLAVQTEDEARKICEHGLKQGHALDGQLGQPNKGVYLSRHPDLISGAPFVDGVSGILIVFKVYKGRIQQVAPDSRHLEPIPNSDCHVSRSTNASTDKLAPGFLFAQSRMFLYEYHESLMETIEYPRNVCPFAVLHFRYKDKEEGRKSSGDQVAWNGVLRFQGNQNQVIRDTRLVSSYARMKPFGLGMNLSVKHLVPLEKVLDWEPIRLLATPSNQTLLFKRREVKINSQYASHWRLTVPSANRVLSSEFASLINKMRNSKVVGLTVLRGSTNLILFPSGELTSMLGIPCLDMAPVLHVIAISYRSTLTGLGYAATKDPLDVPDAPPPLSSTLRADNRLQMVFAKMHEVPQAVEPEPEPVDDGANLESVAMDVVEEEEEPGTEKQAEEELMESTSESASSSNALAEPTKKKGPGRWAPIRPSRDPRIQKKIQKIKEESKEALKGDAKEDDTPSISTEYSMASAQPKDGKEEATDVSYSSSQSSSSLSQDKLEMAQLNQSLVPQNDDNSTNEKVPGVEDILRGWKRLQRGETLAVAPPKQARFDLDKASTSSDGNNSGRGSSILDKVKQLQLLGKAKSHPSEEPDGPASPIPVDNGNEAEAWQPRLIPSEMPNGQQPSQIFGRASAQEPAVAVTTAFPGAGDKAAKFVDSPNPFAISNEEAASNILNSGSNAMEKSGEELGRLSPESVQPSLAGQSVLTEGGMLTKEGILVPDDKIFNRARPEDLEKVLEAFQLWKEQGTGDWTLQLHSQVVLSLAEAKKKLSVGSSSFDRLSDLLRLLTKFRRVGVVQLLPNHVCDACPRLPHFYLSCIRRLPFELGKSPEVTIVFLSNLDEKSTAGQEFQREGIFVLKLQSFIDVFLKECTNPRALD